MAGNILWTTLNIVRSNGHDYCEVFDLDILITSDLKNPRLFVPLLNGVVIFFHEIFSLKAGLGGGGI